MMEAELSGERLNDEPPIFRGYSDSELIVAVVVATLACFPAGIFVGIGMGSVSMGLGIALLAALGMVAGGASLFQRWKRGRPDHFLHHRYRVAMADAGWSATRLLRHRGAMSLGRDWPR
jgi:conjugative transfer region protein (TIGR03750 family)